MLSHSTNRLICCQINFSTKFLTAQRSSCFGKTCASTVYLKLQKPAIGVRFFFATSRRKHFKTICINKFRLSGIIVGLCIGCATLKKYLDVIDQEQKFIFANTAVKAAEKTETSVVEPSYRKMMIFIAETVEKVAPSVVNIETVGSKDPIFGPLTSAGSGFIVRSDGLILTNSHVVQDSRKVLIKLHNGQTYDGIVEFCDSVTDLAVIKINASNLPVLKLADCRRSKAGEVVIAMGSAVSLENSVTFGIISNTQRILANREFSYVQTDAAITSGNNGGPLVNLDGEAVGINNMSVYNIAGMSFAISSYYAAELLKKTSTPTDVFSTKPTYKTLGISTFAVDEAIIKQINEIKKRKTFSDVNHGVLVHTIQYGSAADKVGLSQGDIITEIDNKPIYSKQEMIDAIQNSTGSFQLTVVRENKTFNLIIHPEIEQY